MFSLKPILFFAAKVLVFYLLLVGLFSWWGVSFTRTFNKINTYVFEDFGSNGLVQFKVSNPKKTPFNIKMDIISKKMIAEVQRKAKHGDTSATVKTVFYQFDVWLYAVLPIIVVMSFILASPVPPLQMLKALALGLLISQLIVFLKMGITITDETYRQAWLQVNDSWWHTFFGNPSATAALKDIFKFVGFSLIISVLIWVGVTFRPKDWKRFSRIFDQIDV
ncbi:MAG: hypothetical protein R3E32_08065 [Chitinophagales bacterium]